MAVPCPADTPNELHKQSRSRLGRLRSRSVRAAQIGRPADVFTEWHGPAAPEPLPEARPLRGRLVTHTIDSAAIGGARAVTAYLPPPDG
ncbi:MAG: hypothetical protein ACLGIF_06845, partial [Actinomycetes bacterium]